MRHSLYIVLTIGCLAAVPGWAAPPFGAFGGIVGGGNGGAGSLALHGWALDDDGVAAVDIFVDGRLAGRAQYGRHRAGVERRFPGFPDASGAGFGFQLDTTQFLNGLHVVSARVTSRRGERVFLNDLALEFTNLTHNLVPFGRIEFPNPSAQLFGTCNLADPNRRFSVITGFAMDSGVEIGDFGVGWVELLIDGSIFANSRIDCTFDAAMGGLSNCYGLTRLDLEDRFPHLKDSPTAGFRFVLDVGSLISAFGYSPGRHVLTARVGDISGQVANVDEIPVTFFCDDFIGNEGSFGRVGVPANGFQYSGVIQAVGWALDWEGVSRILVYIDGVLSGQAVHGFPRPSVTSLFPGYPDSDGPGWLLPLDTTRLSNGEHQMQIEVIDALGEVTLIGERRFVVNNP